MLIPKALKILNLSTEGSMSKQFVLYSFCCISLVYVKRCTCVTNNFLGLLANEWCRKYIRKEKREKHDAKVLNYNRGDIFL